MKPEPPCFRYAADLTGRINGKSFYWRLPGDIRAKHELLGAFASSLWFPRDFDPGWSELFDCLCDFGWMTDRKIVLVHAALPRLPDGELTIYLSVLRDAVRWWRGDGLHELEVVFPEAERPKIVSLMGEA